MKYRSDFTGRGIPLPVVRRIVSLYIFLFLFSVASYAQTVIHGYVYEQSTNEPVIGATVSVKSTTNGITTDLDGAFTLQVNEELPVTLLVSFIGYRPQEIDVYDADEPVVITFAEKANYLDEVIVTGYSTQQRKAISGSIVSLNFSESITDIAASGFDQMLQGKASGVQISSNSGVPGGGITLRIRGSNSINASVEPLYIVDGVFMSTSNLISTSMGGQTQSNPLADINPSDIENIVILKDANATAIYGSQGANGVVLITTKRGKQNTKATVSLSVSHGWSSAVKKFGYVSGPETGRLVNESVYNTALDNGVAPSAITLPFEDPASLPTYDRISDLFRTAHTSGYEVSAQGGTASSSYYVGLGYLKQESIVKPSDFERYSGRFNYDNNLTSQLKVGTSVSISRTYRNVSSNDNDPKGVINSAIFVRSYLPVYDENGNYLRYGSFENHQALIDQLDNNATNWRLIANLYAEYSILPELKFRSSWSVDKSDMAENNYVNTLLANGISTNGSASSRKREYIVYTAEQLFTWLKSFGRNQQHTVNALVGNTVNATQNSSTSASGTGFATNSLKNISVAATQTGSASKSESRLVSFFGKASYTYDSKYTIDGSVRADASSKFGANNRWGYFPSVGLTWNAGDERFISNLRVFDALKFRASFGYSGNQNGIGNYAALGLWEAGYNYLNTAGTAATQLANPDLTWETTRQFDIGVEFGVLNNRLHVSFDYYDKYTYDLLLDVPVPFRSGFSSYLQNYGSVSNRGIEFTLNTVNIENRAFKWTSDLNISRNRNQIKKLASDITMGASGRNTSILREGYAVNSFYLYKQLYVDPQTGNAVYEDVNGDGLITSADRQIVGDANPDFTGGFTNEFTYKNFTLNLFFYFQYGNKILNMQDFFLVHGGTQNNIGFLPRQLERWQNPGDVTDIPRMTTYSGDPTENGGAANNYGGNVANLSSRYLEDASFLRLKNVSLSYQIPTSVISRLHISRARATLSATNLLTFTKYGGVDPEVSAQSNNQNTAGYDWATVPQPRTIQLSLNVTF